MSSFQWAAGALNRWWRGDRFVVIAFLKKKKGSELVPKKKMAAESPSLPNEYTGARQGNET